uniref:Uncharacterized protein n=1 Tax=Arundo donax TaxID=35708 RepID=A0A0A8ZLP9_ARUDO
MAAQTTAPSMTR